MMYPLDKRGKTRIGYVKEKGIMPLEQAASIDFRVTEGWLSFKKKILELVAPCSIFYNCVPTLLPLREGGHTVSIVTVVSNLDNTKPYIETYLIVTVCPPPRSATLPLLIL